MVEAFGSSKRKRAMKSRLQNKIDSDELGHSVSNAVDHMLSQPEQEGTMSMSMFNKTLAALNSSHILSDILCE